MCRFLGIPRSLVYYKKKQRQKNSTLENKVIEKFRGSRNNYGTRKTQVELNKEKIVASRHKIGEIMGKYELVSSYTIKQYKVHRTSCNNDNTPNIVNRDFDGRTDLEVIVSD